MFFSEYQCWMVGSRSTSTRTNKIEFKNQFGIHLEERREKSPDQWVRKLLEMGVMGP